MSFGSTYNWRSTGQKQDLLAKSFMKIILLVQASEYNSSEPETLLAPT